MSVLITEGPNPQEAHFSFMLIYGAALMLACTALFSVFSRIKFLGHPLSFMMVYLWSRDPDNADVHMSFFGVLQFTAPYLPWALLALLPPAAALIGWITALITLRAWLRRLP